MCHRGWKHLTADRTAGLWHTGSAFNATGLKDVVEHKVTGYLATPFDTDDFARGIEWVLDADAPIAHGACT